MTLHRSETTLAYSCIMFSTECSFCGLHHQIVDFEALKIGDLTYIFGQNKGCSHVDDIWDVAFGNNLFPQKQVPLVDQAVVVVSHGGLPLGRVFQMGI